MPKRSTAAATQDLPLPAQAWTAGRIGLQARHSMYVVLVLLSVAWNWQAFTAVIRRSMSSGGSEHYSHIIVLPFLVAYLLYVTREAILAHCLPSVKLGVAVITIGAATVWAATTSVVTADQGPRLSLAMLGLVAMWTGAFITCYGPRALRAATLPFLVLLFMVPLPPVALDATIVFLQKGSAEATAVVFALIGMPAFREGMFFTLPGLTIEVAKECSGIRSSLALLISGLAMAHLLLRTTWTRTLFVVMIVPVAIVKNAIRIALLSWLAVNIDPSFITGSAVHRSGGIPIFVASLAVLGALAWLLRRCEARNP
jgi:exosortase